LNLPIQWGSKFYNLQIQKSQLVSEYGWHGKARHIWTLLLHGFRIAMTFDKFQGNSQHPFLHMASNVLLECLHPHSFMPFLILILQPSDIRSLREELFVNLSKIANCQKQTWLGVTTSLKAILHVEMNLKVYLVHFIQGKNTWSLHTSTSMNLTFIGKHEFLLYYRQRIHL